MLNTFLEIIVLFIQKIVLGGIFALSFLGIPVNTEPALSVQTSEEIPAYSVETKKAPEEIPPPEIITPKEDGAATEPAAPPKVPPPAPIAVQVSPIPSLLPSVPPAPSLIPQAELNDTVRKSIVNIFCLTKTVGVIEPITGSGVIIDSRGIILTNAHVAQYLLLRDYLVKDFLNCVIRGGSPATPLYKAEILYLPPLWIEQNALGIKLDKPTGTGENDFALLRITESTSPTRALPESFPAMPVYVSENDINIEDPVLLAGYPAGFLGGTDVTKNLWLTSSITSLKKLYTFRDQTLDGFSLGGTVLAQSGASGGGVFSLKTGELIGLIATSLLEGSTDERDLRAISLFHINERVQSFTGQDLKTFLSGDLKQKSAEFNSTVAPRLTQILTDVLERK